MNNGRLVKNASTQDENARDTRTTASGLLLLPHHLQSQMDLKMIGVDVTLTTFVLRLSTSFLGSSTDATGAT